MSKKHTESTDQLTCRSLTVRADTINEEERSVEAVLSTDGRVQVFDWRSYEIIEEVLDPGGAEHRGQIVLLDSHSRWSTSSVRGSIRNIRVDGNQLIGRLYVAKDDPEADRVWNLIKQRHLTDVSIGYRSLEYVDIQPKSTQNVNGRSYTAGDRRLRITSRYALHEGSLVPIGADAAAKIREEHRLILERQKMEPEVKVEAADTARQETAPSADTQRAAPTVAHPPATIPVEAQGRSNVTEILESQKKAWLKEESDRRDMCRAEAEGLKVDAQLIERAEKEGWDTERVRKEYLDAHRKATSPAPITGAPAGHVSRDATADTLAGGMMMRMGIDPAVLCRNGVDGNPLPADRQQWERAMNEGERYQSLSMYDICREAVRIHGARDPQTGSSPVSQEGFIRAGLSTPSLGYAFTTSVNARLVGSYMESSPNLDFCEMVDVANFKANEVIGLSKGTSLSRLPRGKTADHATFSDEQESYRIHRFAEQMVIDEQDLIDDNLEVFNTVAPEMGMRAAAVMPDMIYYLLLSNPTLTADNTAVFDDTAHANANSNALNAGNLKTGLSRVAKQRQNGFNLDIKAQYLICGPTLEWTARELIESAQIMVATGSDTTLERGTKNTLMDVGLQVRSSARLENGVTDPVTGTAASGSSTTWFLASRPFRTIRGAYRTGTGRRPVLRRFVLEQGRWGIGWDINLDVGAAILGYRGLYRGNT